MPRYNVELDGEWACFSGVVDAFVPHLFRAAITRGGGWMNMAIIACL